MPYLRLAFVVRVTRALHFTFMAFYLNLMYSITQVFIVDVLHEYWAVARACLKPIEMFT